ncbi:Peptidoglycan/LPS O-acetylase OafA/YrhL, contains acyltransferase and SGNH-hydrolase domains [Paenibacillus sp. yr247]|uniref:acyltransferase family protein n=1 Tax=Paenibacillus sp. yr247 TaxID=1761880 RepID=UPI00088DDE9D|nr:acyltransferase [Paenibacillus sp. yr247]SDN34930.1 Peptidoglycan/LPS O-acetylase OafA/YrhL, contains acyltransferase and SGNH-hydrolase domains [Paenibacillus sp. yr247]
MSRKLVGIPIEDDSRASKYLDFLRFFAALTVLVQHLSPTFGVAGAPPGTGVWLKDFIKLSIYEWSQSGFKFVMVFFVLSGFFVSSSVLKMIDNDRWSWRIYLTNRLTRLWIVLIPALLLTVAWKYIQYHLFGMGDESLITTDLRWTTFLGNVFFLQGIRGVHLFGHNGPLWSLSFEFWYYILFPCIVLAIKSPKWITRLIYTVATAVIAWFVGIGVIGMFPVWLLGSLLVMVRTIRINSVLIATMLILVSLALDVLSVNSTIYNYLLGSHIPIVSNPLSLIPALLPNMVVGISFSITIYLVLCFFNNKSLQVSSWNPYRKLAGFSYSLYLLHYPTMDFFYELKRSKWWHFPRELNFYHWFPVVALIVIIYSWIISLLTEARTDKLRRFILRLISNKNEIGKVKNI